MAKHEVLPPHGPPVRQITLKLVGGGRLEETADSWDIKSSSKASDEVCSNFRFFAGFAVNDETVFAEASAGTDEDEPISNDERGINFIIFCISMTANSTRPGCD